jgi:hypothetical protein
MCYNEDEKHKSVKVIDEVVNQYNFGKNENLKYLMRGYDSKKIIKQLNGLFNDCGKINKYELLHVNVSKSCLIDDIKFSRSYILAILTYKFDFDKCENKVISFWLIRDLYSHDSEKYIVTGVVEK